MQNTVRQQLKQNFKQGKAYMINLTVGLTPIQFEAEVAEWGTDENINIGSETNPWDKQK